MATLQPLQIHEARLFCNLILSYANFLLDEHAKHVGKAILSRP